jgi:hypothetical protein
MTRFNITALQEQGMTPEEINAYIARHEQAMYGGPGNSGAPTTQSDTPRIKGDKASLGLESSTTGPRPSDPTRSVPIEKSPLGLESSTTGPRPQQPSESDSFQSLLDNVKEKTKRPDTPAVVQEKEPETLANFQAILEKLQGG